MSETTLDSMTVKDLQAELVTLGMPQEDAATFTAKAPIIATINALKTSQAAASVVPATDPKEDKKVNKAWLSKAQIMRDKLEAQPKYDWFWPLGPKEKPGIVEEVIIRGRKEYKYISGAVDTVILQGCTTFVPKGVRVKIPKQVHDILSEYYQVIQSAGSDMLIDRQDPKTGKTVRDQLS